MPILFKLLRRIRNGCLIDLQERILGHVSYFKTINWRNKRLLVTTLSGVELLTLWNHEYLLNNNSLEIFRNIRYCWIVLDVRWSLIGNLRKTLDYCYIVRSFSFKISLGMKELFKNHNLSTTESPKYSAHGWTLVKLAVHVAAAITFYTNL